MFCSIAKSCSSILNDKLVILLMLTTRIMNIVDKISNGISKISRVYVIHKVYNTIGINIKKNVNK